MTMMLGVIGLVAIILVVIGLALSVASKTMRVVGIIASSIGILLVLAVAAFFLYAVTMMN